MAGPRFVAVPADRLLGELREIGTLVAAKGGKVVEGRARREVLFDISPPGGSAVVRVFTSLEIGAGEVRDCGEDAVRIAVGVVDGEGKFRPVEAGSQKILRTAPQGVEDRVAAFLARLREAIRQAYGRARGAPTCPLCGAGMGLRRTRDKTRSFYGCVRYPACRGTKSA